MDRGTSVAMIEGRIVNAARSLLMYSSPSSSDRAGADRFAFHIGPGGQLRNITPHGAILAANDARCPGEPILTATSTGSCLLTRYGCRPTLV